MIGTILGHYRIVERLGEGGMGVVYKAQDLNLDRFVAIKILHPDKTGDDVRRRRFELEAKTASSLQHPNIVTIYDIARERDIDYIVMEYLPGRTMDSVAGRRALPLKRALNFAIQVAGALAKAHSAGIVHRDLKPANIMVLEDDQVKVLDFGLAKLTEDGEASGDSVTRTRMDLTTDGITVGTAAYMSPEQIEGWKVDTRSDIFSFGTLLYEMLSGERAFSGGSQISTLSAILTKEPEPIAELPIELNRMLRRCLQKEPDRRFQSMADLRLGLEELRDDIQSGRLPSLTGPIGGRRTRQTWAVVLVLAALVLAAAAYLYWQSRLGTHVPLHPVQITSYPGEEGVPTLSPDGSQVAFVWEGPAGDNVDVYVRIVAGGEPLRLTTDPNPDGNPSWSPDGRWIAYRNRSGGQSRYYLISPLGGRPQPLITLDAAQGADHSWTPDSRYIVLSGVRDNARRLVKVDVQTREVTPIPYSDGGPSTNDLTSAVSPSGEHIAFFRLENRQQYRLLVIPIGGGTPDEGVPVMYPKGLAWTPNGRELVFGARAQGLTGLWRVKAFGRNREPVRLLGAGENGGEPAFAPASSKHGVRLIYTRSDQELSLSILTLTPDGRVVSEPRRIVSEAARVFEAQLSPDGRNLAFVSDRAGGSQIWISEPSVIDAQQITRMEPLTPGAVRWSPDGSTLVFDARDTSQSDIYTVSAEGGPPVRLTSAPSREARPSFSADGKWIYFRSDRGGSREIWKMPRAEGGDWVQVTRGGGNEAMESEDGKHLLYTKAAGGLYMMPSAGGESTMLSAVARSGLWSLAGNWAIWFESTLADWSTGAFKQVHIYDLKTKKKWMAGTVSVRILSDSGQMSLSTDHRSLYVIRRGQQGDLFLVDDFQ